jgi:hypothetical protein
VLFVDRNKPYIYLEKSETNQPNRILEGAAGLLLTDDLQNVKIASGKQDGIWYKRNGYKIAQFINEMIIQ